MSSDQEILSRLQRIEDRVIEVHAFMGAAHEWRVGADKRLEDYGEDIEVLKIWKTRLVALWSAGAILAGVGFQIIMGLF